MDRDGSFAICLCDATTSRKDVKIYSSLAAWGSDSEQYVTIAMALAIDLL
jgi:hypothetical protein